MTNNVYPLDIRHDEDEAAEVAELRSDEKQHVRDLRDSKRWYQERSGWGSQVERTSEELISLVGTDDVDELDEMLGTKEDPVGQDSRLKEVEDLQETAEWLDDHGWDSEHVWEQVRELKSGGES